MKDLCFVILHYSTKEDTEKCIESIQKRIDTDNYYIIVVDNGSTNKSGVLLEKQYKENNKIKIILNNTNLGFAKGNNVGFQYAKNVIGCKFIVMLNSDTYLLQDDFYQAIYEEYNSSKFAVLGPQIISKNGIEVNQGQKRNPYNIREIKSFIRSAKYHLFMNFFYLSPITYKIRMLVEKNKVICSENIIKEDNIREWVYLFGSTLIFSPDYISKYNGLCDKTFMYFEEEILFYQMIKDGMKTVYNPKIKIFHSKQGATNNSFKRKRDVNIFRCKYQIQSAKILLEMVKDRGEAFISGADR